MRRNQQNARTRCAQGQQRALSALIPLSLAATLGVTSLGCSGDVTSVNGQYEAENELIRSHLADHGYETSDLLFYRDEVVVEGDMAMSREQLLDEAQAEATGVIEKGYFIPENRLFSGKSIRIAFAAGVSNLWKTAFNNAAAEWNRRVPKFSQPGPGSPATITVQMAVDGQNVKSPAKANFPPSRTISINPKFKDEGLCPGQNIEGISATAKLATAVHEIGHSLGFEHPQPISTFGVLIPGTARNTGTASAVSYSTVMTPRGCVANLTQLQPDDVLSASKKYPGPTCIELCEFNCTFNVDPAAIGLCQFGCPSQCGG